MKYALFVMTLLFLCSCTALPDPALQGAIEKQLINSGIDKEAAHAIALAIGQKVADSTGVLPPWAQNAIDAGLFALFPAVYALRNRSRQAELAKLKDELLPKNATAPLA